MGEVTRGALECPLVGGGAHIGIFLIQVLVPLLQDIVRVPNLLPDAHGLGRRGRQALLPHCGHPGSALHHVGKGLGDSDPLAGCGGI